MDVSRAFVADQGFEVSEAAGFYSGSDVPNIVCEKGSIYARTDGSLWLKTGSLSNAWINLSQSTFDENTILVDHKGDVLTDHNGNVLVR